MKNTSIVGAIFLIVGVILLVYQGFSFTHREKVLDIGPIKATADKTERLPIPPIIGWVVAGTGAVLLVGGMLKPKS